MGLEMLLQLVGFPGVQCERAAAVPKLPVAHSGGSGCHIDLRVFDTGVNIVLAQVTRQAAHTVRSDLDLYFCSQFQRIQCIAVLTQVITLSQPSVFGAN